MSLFSDLTNSLEVVSKDVPLPWFVFLGSFIEEVIAPIPSPFVMTLAGTIAASQGNALSYLLVLSVIGAVGKTIGSWVIYVVSDKAEDVIITKFGRILGVSHKDTEGIGKLLNKGVRDDIILFLLRAIPIMPTAPVSVVCGLIKLNMRTYLVSTFLGTVVRNLFYLYVGFTGVEALQSLTGSFTLMETIGTVVVFLFLAALVVWAYFKRKSGGGEDLFKKLHSMMDNKDEKNQK